MIKKSYVDTADGQIHLRYTTVGKGDPLVMFHMTASSSESFEGLMQQLEGVRPAYALDTMNYGESYRTDHAPSVRYIASRLLDALTNLGIERFHTLGHHTGVSIQCEMAVLAPERVLSTIICGPTYATDEERALLLQTLAKPNPISITGTQFIAAWSRIKDSFPVPMLGKTDGQAMVMNRDTIDMLRAGENWDWAYRGVFTHDLPTTMKSVTCPMFFIVGAQDLAYEFHARAVADYPEAAAFVGAEGGVYYLETHPQEAAEQIELFLARLSDRPEDE